MGNLFQNMVVVVTGASSGIGRATAIEFVKNGARVAFVSRGEEAMRATISDHSVCTSENSLIIPADLSSYDVPEEVVKKVVDEWGKLDVLVNCAAILRSNTAENASFEDWNTMLNLNVISLALMSKFAIPFLKKTRGNIVNVSSIAGLRSFNNLLTYSTSKAAVDQITRCTALDISKYGIRVNAVNPGVVISKLHRRGGMTEEEYEQFLSHSKDTHPLGRVGNPEEIADLILFLASPKASWITGETISVDGGRFLTCLR